MLLLGGAVRGAVDVGRVEQGDAGIEGGVHHRAGAVGVQLAAEVVAAESHDGDDEAGRTEAAVAHLTHDPSLCRVADRADLETFR
jgi:hypothetical protein